MADVPSGDNAMAVPGLDWSTLSWVPVFESGLKSERFVGRPTWSLPCHNESEVLGVPHMIDFDAAARSILAHLSRASSEAMPGDGRSADAGAREDGASGGPRLSSGARSVAASPLALGGPTAGAPALGSSSPVDLAFPSAPGVLPAPSAPGIPSVPVPPGHPGSAAVTLPTALPDGTSVTPQQPAATLLGGRTGSATPSLPDTGSALLTPTAQAPAGPGVWQRFIALMAGVLGVSTVRESTLAPAAEVAAITARALVPELSLPNIEAAMLGVRAPKSMVRPTIATVAFAARARMAWQRASQASTPAAREHHVAEGVAWTERASRAARALQRALPAATESDRALRALLRTGLGALQDVHGTPLVAIDALRQIELSVRALASRYGIAMPDPLGPSGRSDVPGFLARLEGRRTRKTLLAALVFTLPMIVLGLIYLAMAG